MRNIQILTLFSILIFCSQYTNKVKTINKNELKKNNNNLEPRNKSNKKMLIGTWISITESRDNIENKLVGIHKLELNDDGSFNSFYQSSNRKSGSWKMVSDSVFRLYMKAVDDYIIKSLNDSIMIAQLGFITSEQVIIKYEKK